MRLIDVVLILLFGFISISEISRRTQITLPKSKNIRISDPDKEAILIVGITKNGHYLIENESEVITNARLLRYYIVTKRAEFEKKNAELRVRIRSDFNAPVKYTILLANICDAMQIPKSIDVQHKGT